MKRILFFSIIILLQACSTSKNLKFKKSMQRTEDQSLDVQSSSDTISLYGTLTLPKAADKIPLAIIIAGSGPTDRNCNNPMGESDTYKMIAEGLMEQGIATLRYDKRGIGESVDSKIKEEDMRFSQMVDDVLSWIKKYELDPRFSSISILGHSEGSLVGILAAQKSQIHKFVSLAGPARSADVIILEQIGKQMPFAVPNLTKQLAIIKKGEFIEKVDPTMYALLRPSVQPYLHSWFQYTPTEEIQKLSIPVLIVQGTTDIQVEIMEANFLHKASVGSSLLILDQSNHIFKDAPLDRMENLKTYSDPSLPLSDGLMEKLVAFILN